MAMKLFWRGMGLVCLYTAFKGLTTADISSSWPIALVMVLLGIYGLKHDTAKDQARYKAARKQSAPSKPARVYYSNLTRKSYATQEALKKAEDLYISATLRDQGMI